MIEKLKNFICKLFHIKQCKCSEKDEHLQLYEDELARALAEDGSASSTYITPKVYYPGV